MSTKLTGYVWDGCAASGMKLSSVAIMARQAEELESRGLYRRAATVWMAAFRESHSQPERNNFLARREQCLRKSSKRAVSSDEWYLSGNYVGA